MTKPTERKIEKSKRHQRVLTIGTPSITKGIADAVVIKNENIFFLTEPNGSVPLGEDHGLGLYYHDCRFLNGYELRLADTIPDVLVTNALLGFKAIFELSNPEIAESDGKRIPKDSVGIKWERLVDNSHHALDDVLTFHNYGRENIDLPIELAFDADFADIFDIRGLVHEKMGKRHSPLWRDNVLYFQYDGTDQLHRSLSIYFSPMPHHTRRHVAYFRLKLKPREDKQLLVSLVIAESRKPKNVRPQTHYLPNRTRSEAIQHRATNDWMANQTQVQSDSFVVNNILERSLRDIRLLRMNIGRQELIAAGVPWFTTLFGRDSLITELQTLAYDAGTAPQTLRILAKYQGKKIDPWRNEQPGKILHEIRLGELAHTHQIPHTPYYGTVDATPLFLILMSRYSEWVGNLNLFHELKENVERALDWISSYGDSDGDGYIDYHNPSGSGLTNQGWKDSGDAIVNADGSLATPPIALVEVQGYVYLAKIGIAKLYEQAREMRQAERLKQEAEDLRQRFNRDYWIENKKLYALALQAHGKPAAVLSSNPGQALWSGIIDADKANQVVQQLMSDDMFNGWGIRTLSENEDRYNPLGYHLGTVWPHDNSLIAAGFRRYGFDDAAQKITDATIEAALYFENYRLPELFAGLSRAIYDVPVSYPVACHPQAWSAGAIPYLIETMLGLTPEAFDHRLRIVRPRLPRMVNHVELRKLRVGKARADLSFERNSDGTVSVHVDQVLGHLDVVTQPSP